MNRSSTPWSEGVKQRNAKLKEQLISLLELNTDQVVMEGVNEYLAIGARKLLELVMHAEAQQRCGKYYSRSQEREAQRWGSEKGTAIIDGVKGTIERPRIRALRSLGGSGTELQLETYKAMNRAELIDGPLTATILSGVSARRYASILRRGLEAKGVSKSAVSRRAIAATKPTVDQFLKKRLDNLDLVALLFDGIHIAKKQMIVCIGVDMRGHKHVLGLRVGATENDIVCRDLIRDLIDRGVSNEKRYLFIVDGSKALVNTIRAAFGQEAAIQRCQEHKIRDVQGYVPVKLRAGIRAKLQAAYNQTSEKEALKRLSKIREELGLVSENAVNSLTEGMYETLTVHRLGITGLLRKSLRTTNIMESAFSSVRRYMGRVTRFKNEAQIDLWVTRSILEAERHFRPLQGCRQLRKLRERLLTYKR